MRADVAFAGLQFVSKEAFGWRIEARQCRFAVCEAIHWASQVRQLAMHIQAHAQLRTAVHLWSPCLRPIDVSRLWPPEGPPVTVHARHGARFTEALKRMSDNLMMRDEAPEWRRRFILLLLKWSVVGIENASIVVYIDFDMEVMPRGIPPSAPSFSLEGPATWEWITVLRCFNQSRRLLLSIPDHSAPVNTAFLMLKPSSKLYEEGIDVLQRAADGRFNRTHGWDLVGRPSRTVSLADDSWTRGSEMRTRDSWEFVCAALDQGFFFYMFRVRHAAGGDMDRACALDLHRHRNERALLRHYAGGAKPMETVTVASQQLCTSRLRNGQESRPRLRFLLFRRLVRAQQPLALLHPLAREVTRALSWGVRANASLADQYKGLSRHSTKFGVQRQDEEIVLEAAAALSDTLLSCVAAIDRGVRCLMRELDVWNLSYIQRGKPGHVEHVSARKFIEHWWPLRRGGIHGAIPEFPALPRKRRRRNVSSNSVGVAKPTNISKRSGA
jgi:hypothetical protein